MNFEAGNETRENFRVVLVLHKIEERSEKRVDFCSFRCFRESEKLRCEEKFCKRAKFCVHVRLFKSVLLGLEVSL